MDYVEILEKQSKALIVQLTELTHVKTPDKSMTNYTINLLFTPCVCVFLSLIILDKSASM